MKISDKVINRLTLYHCILTDYADRSIEYISSPQIAGLLHIDDSQVRKDLKILCPSGIRRIGYNVVQLKEAIENMFCFTNSKKAFIVGAGNLGAALSKYDDFDKYGLTITALFDNDPLKVDTVINNKKVYHISKLPEFAKKENIETVILTVPRKYAQEVADFLLKAGIEHIWNFTPCILNLPENINVWNENLMGSCLQFVSHNR